MKQILIFTLTFLFFGITKGIVDHIPVVVVLIFISVAMLFTYELIQLLKKEKKNNSRRMLPVIAISYNMINISRLNSQKKIICSH